MFIMKFSLFYFAIIAWIISFIIHFLTYADIDLTQYFPFYVLFIGIFVVWVPTILRMRKNKNLLEYHSSHIFNRFNPFGFYNALFRETPYWLKYIAIGSFVYGLINFFLFFNSVGGVTGFHDGQYVIQNRGEIVKVLTKQEYVHYQALETRGFSGHWLIFYGIAAAVLYPFNNQE